MIYLEWFLWLASAAAVAMPLFRSQDGGGRTQLAIPIGVLLIGTALMLVAGTMPSGRPLVPGLAWLTGNASTAELQLDAIHARLDQLETQLSDARTEETRLVAELPPSPGLPAVSEGPVTGQEAAGPSAARQAILLMVLLLLLLLDAAVLLLNGRFLSFPGFGKDARRDEQLALLDQLAILVWKQEYRSALAKAAEVLELKLRQRELLDLYFLRGYAAVQVYSFPEAAETGEYRITLLESAIKDLEEVTTVAINRGEALYLLALAYGLARRDADALGMFKRASGTLDGVELPFAHNESVCLLRLGEHHLSLGEIEAAERFFDRVATLGQLGAAVLQVRIRIAMIDLRNAMSRKTTDAARVILNKAGGFSGLTEEQKSTLDVIGIELKARDALTQGDPDLAASAAESFLAKYMPSGMPPLDDAVMDEVFSSLRDDDLSFPREVYRDILFMLAIARALIETRRRPVLTEHDVAHIAEPLLRALQIEPRHRDLLAAIGGLYYWTRRDLRINAREWLEAAVTMGVESRYARIILARDRAVEADRREVLDLFRSTSARFLRDPSLTAEMRRALAGELGRFQEFEPILIALQEKRDDVPEEPTLSTLKDRAKYLADLLANAIRRGDQTRYARLASLKAEYVRVLTTLEESASSIEALERSVIVELGTALVLT